MYIEILVVVMFISRIPLKVGLEGDSTIYIHFMDAVFYRPWAVTPGSIFLIKP